MFKEATCDRSSCFDLCEYKIIPQKHFLRLMLSYDELAPPGASWLAPGWRVGASWRVRQASFFPCRGSPCIFSRILRRTFLVRGLDALTLLLT